MKSRFLIYTLIISMLFGVISQIPAYAEEAIVIKIEAEDFEGGETMWAKNKNDTASGGVSLSAWHPVNPNGKYVYEYTFMAPKKGIYRMDGVFSEQGNVTTTDISFYINTPDNAPKSFSKGADKGNYMFSMSGTTVKLNKGKNVLYMSPKTSDPNHYGVLAAYLDYFTFTKLNDSEFAIEKVLLVDHTTGVYEHGEPVKLQFNFTSATKIAKQFKIQITDLYDRVVTSDVITVKRGVDSYVTSLGVFPVGWYRVRIKDIKSDMDLNTYTAFSVVVPYSQRPGIDDSSIAADASIAWGEWGVTEKNRDDWTDVAKFAGLKWLRSRTAGDRSSPEMMQIGEMLKEKGIEQMALTDVACMIEFSQDDWRMQGNLYDIAYKRWQKNALWYEDTLGVLEVINEADILPQLTSPAETYASYYKAAAIGISDLEEGPYQSFTPTASPGNTWVDLLYRNDVVQYSDILNYHAHEGVGSRTKEIRTKGIAYGAESIPMWIGEAGFSQVRQDGDSLSLSQMRTASRIMITRAMEALTNGTAKYFWFLLTPYIENNGNFSSHHTSGLPYPMYSVLSNMTYQMGEAVFKGSTDYGNDIHGYMFDDGVGNDVLVTYADQQNYITIKADKIKYSDMIGTEEVKTADENGEIKIFVSEDPVFVKFYGRAPEDMYFKKTYSSELKRKTFEPHERIVIQQHWPDTITTPAAARSQGYQLLAGEEYEMTYTVYNLNDKQMSGVIKSSADEQIVITTGEQTFDIEPWGNQEFTFTFKVKKDSLGGSDGNIRFYGDTEGGEISSSVAYFKILAEDRVIPDEDRVNFENYNSPDRWSLANKPADAVAKYSSDDEGNGIFNVKLPNLRWFFPQFKITEEEIEVLKEANGFVFDATALGSEGNPGLQMFVYMKDGRQYYSTSLYYRFADMENEYRCCIFPYTKFDLYVSPLGAVEIRTFDVESIESISIGFSGAPIDVPEYRFKNFGYFYSDLKSEQLVKGDDINIIGIESNKTYNKEDFGITKAQVMVQKEMDSYRVVLNNDELEIIEIKDGIITFDLTGIERGDYDLSVIAFDKQNAFVSGLRKFKVK